MNVSRRFMKFCALGGLGMLLLGLLAVPGESAPAGDKPPRYKVIYNWDGAPRGYSKYPQSVEDFVDHVFAPLKDTQVDALFWCTGTHEATWASEKIPMPGDALGRRYTSVRNMVIDENILAMIERGENPFQALVERGRELGIAVYASIRMNDNHFHGLQVEEMAETEMGRLSEFRKQHPEWCLGADEAPPWFALSWNMSIPEVREYRFQYIKEAIAQAEWDGIELDWQRHGFHLPKDEGKRLSYAITDLQRAVRNHTQDIAKRRGQPFYVAVRVATTPESCGRIGYDLRTWIDEDLCDIIVAGGGAGTDPGTEVEAFRELIGDKPIRFYPGFDSGFWGEYHGLEPRKQWNRAMYRAYATGFWRRGVDGIYAFNWHASETGRRDLLTTVGAPETLKNTDKVYAALHREVRESGLNWSGADKHDRIYGETPVRLYRTLTRRGPTFRVDVHDDVASASSSGELDKVELRVGLAQFSSQDQVEVTFDGVTLVQPRVERPKAGTSLDLFAAGDHSWLVWTLSPRQAALGTHEVEVRLIKRDPRLRPALIVDRVEMHVRYNSVSGR